MNIISLFARLMIWVRSMGARFVGTRFRYTYFVQCCLSMPFDVLETSTCTIGTQFLAQDESLHHLLSMPRRCLPKIFAGLFDIFLKSRECVTCFLRKYICARDPIAMNAIIGHMNACRKTFLISMIGRLEDDKKKGMAQFSQEESQVRYRENTQAYRMEPLMTITPPPPMTNCCALDDFVAGVGNALPGLLCCRGLGRNAFPVADEKSSSNVVSGGCACTRTVEPIALPCSCCRFVDAVADISCHDSTAAPFLRGQSPAANHARLSYSGSSTGGWAGRKDNKTSRMKTSLATKKRR